MMLHEDPFMKKLFRLKHILKPVLEYDASVSVPMIKDLNHLSRRIKDLVANDAKETFYSSFIAQLREIKKSACSPHATVLSLV